MSGEDAYVKAIKRGINSINTGEKTPKDSNVASNLNRLKKVNEGMYDDYLNNYKATLIEYKKNNPE